MENNTSQQEVLLVTASSLCKRNFCDKRPGPGEQSGPACSRLGDIEQLEDACWNGILEEWLPGLIVKPRGKKIFVWQVHLTHSFLHIRLCETIPMEKKEHSINPCLFLGFCHYN